MRTMWAGLVMCLLALAVAVLFKPPPAQHVGPDKVNIAYNLTNAPAISGPDLSVFNPVFAPASMAVTLNRDQSLRPSAKVPSHNANSQTTVATSWQGWGFL